jgi:hypothetical protein
MADYNMQEMQFPVRAPRNDKGDLSAALGDGDQDRFDRRSALLSRKVTPVYRAT